MGQINLWSRSPPRLFTYIRNPFNFTLLRKLHPDSGFAACSFHPAKALHHHPGDSLYSWSGFNVSYISWLPFSVFLPHFDGVHPPAVSWEKVLEILHFCRCLFFCPHTWLIMWLDIGFRVGIHFLPSLFFCPPFWEISYLISNFLRVFFF